MPDDKYLVDLGCPRERDEMVGEAVDTGVIVGPPPIAVLPVEDPIVEKVPHEPARPERRGKPDGKAGNGEDDRIGREAWNRGRIARNARSAAKPSVKATAARVRIMTHG